MFVNISILVAFLFCGFQAINNQYSNIYAIFDLDSTILAYSYISIVKRCLINPPFYPKYLVPFLIIQNKESFPCCFPNPSHEIVLADLNCRQVNLLL